MLYSDTLLDELYQRGEATNGSFLVSLLSRDEPPIRAFREAIEAWHREVPEAYQARFSDRLRSAHNEEFFQAFCEVSVHNLMRRGAVTVEGYPDPWSFPYFQVSDPESRSSALVSTVSFIPDDHPVYAQQALQEFIDELNTVSGLFRFAVYVRRWLPPGFDPAIVRRALESWFSRLEMDPHGVPYAEYRDGDIHVEFSVLERLEEPSAGLVSFHISPLESNEIVQTFQHALEDEVERFRKLTDRSRPLVVVLFNNEEWRLATNYLHECFYGKPRYTFAWKSDGRRRETVRDFGTPFGPSIFNSGLGDDLGAVLLAEKVWDDNRMRLKVRVLENPWCPRVLPAGLFERHTRLVPIKLTPEQAFMRWENLESLMVDLT